MYKSSLSKDLMNVKPRTILFINVVIRFSWLYYTGYWGYVRPNALDKITAVHFGPGQGRTIGRCLQRLWCMAVRGWEIKDIPQLQQSPIPMGIVGLWFFVTIFPWLEICSKEFPSGQGAVNHSLFQSEKLDQTDIHKSQLLVVINLAQDYYSVYQLCVQSYSGVLPQFHDKIQLTRPNSLSYPVSLQFIMTCNQKTVCCGSLNKNVQISEYETKFDAAVTFVTFSLKSSAVSYLHRSSILSKLYHSANSRTLLYSKQTLINHLSIEFVTSY